MDTLYFDGACPLCRREIRLLRRLTRGRLLLVDVHQLRDIDPEADRPDPEAMLRLLHLQTGEGRWLVGLDANIRAWQHTRWGLFWRLLAIPPLRGLAEQVYRRWASRRYARRYACGRCLGDERPQDA